MSFIGEYLPGLWNSLVNLLNYLIMDKISSLKLLGLWRNYTEYLSKEKFIMRISFAYLIVNVIFVPMFSLTVGDNLLNLAKKLFTWKSYSRTFLLSDSGRILSNSQLLRYNLLSKFITRILKRLH